MTTLSNSKSSRKSENSQPLDCWSLYQPRSLLNQDLAFIESTPCQDQSVLLIEKSLHELVLDERHYYSKYVRFNGVLVPPDFGREE